MDKPSLSASSFLSLAETFTGFQDNPTSGQNNPTASSGSSINFNGTGTRGATFQINGVNNDDSSENQNRQGAALSTIQEFQVLKNGYSAEFGRGDGAVVLVQTKSGTNQYHGDVYLYQQNGAWNAKSFFAQAAPKPIRHRSGVRLHARLPGRCGTSSSRSATSIARSRTARTPSPRDFFTPAELAAPRLTRGNDTPANRAWIQSILDRFPDVHQQRFPQPPDDAPACSAINQPDEDASGRLDWNVARGNTLTGRYQWTRQIREAEDVIVGEQALQKNKQQNLGITWTRVIGLEHGRRGPLRPGRPLHERRHRGRQRHADRPLHGQPGRGLDHRQRRQLPDPPRSDGSPVRLQPDGAGVPDPLVQDRRRHPPPGARRSRRQLLARLLDVQRESAAA